MADAVVCRQLGYKFAMKSSTLQNPSEVPVWLGKVQCDGNEGSLKECSNDGWQTHTCNSVVDGLRCYNESEFRIL